MNTRILFFTLVFLLLVQQLVAQNTPWDIIYCLNGGENKSAGISKLTSPNPVAKPGWNLIFSDEFQADSLNPEKWNRSTRGDDQYNGCLRQFGINPDNTIIENGYAKIINSIDQQLPDCPYSFGEIKTMSVRDTAFKSFYFYAPGYLETRVKLYNKTGQGAACWLWGVGTPENPGSPGQWNEIDVFELNGVNSNIFNGAYHWTKNGIHVSQNHSIYLTDSSLLYDLSMNWTTFGLEWDTASIKWFVNNQLVKELDLTKIPPFCIPATNYSQPVSPFCVRFNSGNNSVGNQSGIPNPADFPQSMLVDYVRVYKKTGHKASPILISDGQNQICATATSPETSEKIIQSPYYPEALHNWSSPAFEMQTLSLPIPQPPDKMLIWIKPNATSGQSYPIYYETHFPSGYTEYDTAYIFIAQESPTLPPDEFFLSQVDTLCDFSINTLAPPNISGCDFSLDNGLKWNPGTLLQNGGFSICRFGKFKPEQVVNFAFREQNGCGYSPVRFSTITIPLPPVGCKWPANVDDTLGNQSGGAPVLVWATPNPVSNTMNVRLYSKIYPLQKTIQLRIFDVHARKIVDERLLEQDTKLDLSYLHHGVYCLHIQQDNNIVYKSIFVKN